MDKYVYLVLIFASLSFFFFFFFKATIPTIITEKGFSYCIVGTAEAEGIVWNFQDSPKEDE